MTSFKLLLRILDISMTFLQCLVYWLIFLRVMH